MTLLLLPPPSQALLFRHLRARVGRWVTINSAVARIGIAHEQSLRKAAAALSSAGVIECARQLPAFRYRVPADAEQRNPDLYAQLLLAIDVLENADEESEVSTA